MAARPGTEVYLEGRFNKMKTGKVGLPRFGLGSEVNSGTYPEMEQVRTKPMPAVSRDGSGRLGGARGKE